MKKLIPNLSKVISAHITLRDNNRSAIVTTMLNTGFQILSNDENNLALNLIFEPREYPEDAEFQKRFLEGKYCSLFENDENELFLLDINENNITSLEDIITDILVNVYGFPIYQDLQTEPEIYIESSLNIDFSSVLGNTLNFSKSESL